MLTLIILCSIGVGNVWGQTTIIASWGKVSISASKAVTASGGDTNNKGVAQFSSTKPMTTAGTNCYYGASAGGAVITFSNLNLSGYTDVKMTFYTRASKQGNMKIQYTTNGNTWTDLDSPGPGITKSEAQKKSSTIPNNATGIKLTHSASSGSLYFGTVEISGTKNSPVLCSECTYYVYNGSTWESIGTTGFDEVVLAPPTLPGNGHGAGNGCWVKDKTFFDGGCTRNINNNNNDYRFVPNPDGTPPDADNKPGSGTCELYAVYFDDYGCLSTTVTAVQCARIWEEPEPITPSVSGSDVTLSWSSVTGASGYHLYVTDYYSYEFDEIVDGTNKTLTGLAAGTYSWTVAANSPKNDACDSKPADGEDFVIDGCTDISSSTVTGVSVTPSKVGGSATWTAVANATSYEVKVYAGTATSGVALFSAEPTSNSCTITGLNASTQYTVVVKAKNSCSTSNQGKATWTTSALTLYTVTFVNQSGAAVSPAKQSTEGGSVTLPSASPSVACAAFGWTFAGWKDGSALTETTETQTLIAAGSYTPSENKTFYAVFTKTEGGGGGVKTTLLSDSFDDVEGTDDGSTSWTVADPWTSITGDVYKASYALRLGKSGGTGGVTSKSLSASVGTTIKVTLDVKKWSSDAGDVRITVSGVATPQDISHDDFNNSEYTPFEKSFVTTTADFTITIETTSKRAFIDNVEVYYGGGGGGTTYWNSNPSCSNEAKVTYHNDGAKSGAAPTDANSPYTIGAQVTVLGTGTMVAPDGKEFKCWNTAPDGKGTDYNIDAKFEIAANMDFYPKWVNAPYTVRFDAEDGTCGTTSLAEASGGAGVILPAATATCALAGWSFYGWATSACSSTTSAPSIVGATGETYYPESDITLHAVYVNSGTYNSNPVCHEVTIGSQTNGTINVNSSTTSPQTVTQGTTVNIAATPESGYRFTGWTIKKTTGGNDVTSTLLGANATTASTSFTMPDYDVTVSATFEAIVYHTVTWKKNGVTLTGAKLGSADVSVEHGLKVANLPPDLSSTSDDNCDGESNVFVGWTSNSWSGKQADAPAILFKKAEDAPAVNADVTYHAVWAKPE